MSAISAPASAATPRATASETPPAASRRCTAQKPMTAPIKHHPLDPEVEDARALGQKLAERGEQERRPVEHGRGEDQHEEARVDARDHGAASAAAALAAGAVLPNRIR